jgi:hypothetical protein
MEVLAQLETNMNIVIAILILVLIFINIRLELYIDRAEDGNVYVWYTGLTSRKRKCIKLY